MHPTKKRTQRSQFIRMKIFTSTLALQGVHCAVCKGNRRMIFTHQNKWSQRHQMFMLVQYQPSTLAPNDSCISIFGVKMSRGNWKAQRLQVYISIERELRAKDVSNWEGQRLKIDISIRRSSTVIDIMHLNLWTICWKIFIFAFLSWGSWEQNMFQWSWEQKMSQRNLEGQRLNYYYYY